MAFQQGDISILIEKLKEISTNQLGWLSERLLLANVKDSVEDFDMWDTYFDDEVFSIRPFPWEVFWGRLNLTFWHHFFIVFGFFSMYLYTASIKGVDLSYDEYGYFLGGWLIATVAFYLLYHQGKYSHKPGTYMTYLLAYLLGAFGPVASKFIVVLISSTTASS